MNPSPSLVDRQLPVQSGARLSPDGVYRYALTRVLCPIAEPVVCWIMLNPSKADALTDDPTVRRCMQFSRNWDFGAMIVVNLFALRSTDPVELQRYTDPVGPENQYWLGKAVALSSRVVCAWGEHGGLYGRDVQVLRFLRFIGETPYCLGTTRQGRPRHPVRLAYSTKLQVLA